MNYKKFTTLSLKTRHLYAGVFVGMGLCLALYIVSGEYDRYIAKQVRDACRKEYPFTSRTLGCITFDANSDRIHSLDAKLDAAASVYVQDGKASRVSIFVRDLTSQQWAASNENEVYAPASLMKLPLLMAYYKIGELDPSFFSERIAYAKAPAVSDSGLQDFAPADPIAVGKTYTVEDLIGHMIVNSDNAAADLLYSHINPDVFNQTAIDLGIKIPANNSTVDFVTAKTYAGIIRMLYNSSYLNRASSEKVLSLMSTSAFKGVADSVPEGIVVAHKFGERQVDGVSGSAPLRELHDCGIVYKDPNPYVICIMTEGKNFDDLLSVVKNLSALVYENI